MGGSEWVGGSRWVVVGGWEQVSKSTIYLIKDYYQLNYEKQFAINSKQKAERIYTCKNIMSHKSVNK